MVETSFFSQVARRRDLPLSKWVHRFRRNVSMLCCSREQRQTTSRKRLKTFRMCVSIPWKRLLRRQQLLQHLEIVFCFRQVQQVSVCLKMNLTVGNNLKKWSEPS